MDEAIAAKRKIMGFGHREYKVKDPRAVILQALVEEMFASFGHDDLYDVARAIEAEAESRLGPKGIYPNVDFYSGLVYRKLGIPRDLFTPVFAIARVAGWLAHWREQLGAGFSGLHRSTPDPSHALGCPLRSASRLRPPKLHPLPSTPW